MPLARECAPLVGGVGNSLQNANDARKVRDLRQPAIVERRESHEAFLAHRSRHAIAHARCGPACVRIARRAAALQPAELPRLHLHRLILAHRGDRSPRSPEATRTPSGSSTRGRFVSGVRKGISTRDQRDALRSRSIRACWPEAGKAAQAQACAVPRCFCTGGTRDASHTDWPLRREANAEHRSNGPQRYGLAGPSGARGAAVAYAGDREKVFRERTIAQGQSSGASRWPPVRIRFVHHWIAQSGRASVSDTESRGFESRSNQRPVTSLQPGASPHQETPRACSAALQSIATPTDAQRRCRRAVALEARGPAAMPMPQSIAVAAGSRPPRRQRDGSATSASGAFPPYSLTVGAASAATRARRDPTVAAEAAPTRARSVKRENRSIAPQSDRTTRANQGELPCSGPRGS